MIIYLITSLNQEQKTAGFLIAQLNNHELQRYIVFHVQKKTNYIPRSQKTNN